MCVWSHPIYDVDIFSMPTRVQIRGQILCTAAQVLYKPGDLSRVRVSPPWRVDFHRMFAYSYNVLSTLKIENRKMNMAKFEPVPCSFEIYIYLLRRRRTTRPPLSTDEHVIRKFPLQVLLLHEQFIEYLLLIAVSREHAHHSVYA